MAITQADRDYVKYASQRLGDLDLEAMRILDAMEARFPIENLTLQDLKELSRMGKSQKKRRALRVKQEKKIREQYLARLRRLVREGKIKPMFGLDKNKSL